MCLALLWPPISGFSFLHISSVSQILCQVISKMNLIYTISLMTLLESVTSEPYHGQMSLQGSPPIVTFDGDDTDCGLCQFLGSTCFVYNIGKKSVEFLTTFEWILQSPGSLKVCTILSLVNPPIGVTCNVVATPGRIACLGMTLICFKVGCGAVRIPSDLKQIVQDP